MSDLNFTRDNLSAAFTHAIELSKTMGETTTVHQASDSEEVLVSLGSVTAGTLTLPEGARVIATATAGGALV